MTPDEFDQKRRELIAMRDHTYRDNDKVRERVKLLLGQLDEMRTATGKHRQDLDRIMSRNLLELSHLTTSQ